MDNTQNPEPEQPASRDKDLLIIELDERLEFGVMTLSSALFFDANSTCTNPSGCNNTSCGSTHNQDNCHNASAC